MKPNKLYLSIIAILFACITSVNLHAQCCKLPDSLKVISVTDSSFCLRWNKNDTSRCDTAKAWQLHYKKVGNTTWKTFKGSYFNDTFHIFCDTVKPCTDWKWQVRNICIKNGDSTFTAWVNGQTFSTKCDTTNKSISNNSQLQLHAVKVTPNPAKNMIEVSGLFIGKLHISVANMTGKKVFERTVVTQGTLNLPINISAYENGFYFINISNEKDILKTNFLKQ